MDKYIFSQNVGKLVEKTYGLEDGEDMCYNLIDMGVIDMAAGEAVAARTVAQYIEQA